MLVIVQCDGAVNGGVDVVSHELTEPLVFGLPEQQLVGAGDTADTFSVCGDENTHLGSPFY
jgi:hypothetical protein